MPQPLSRRPLPPRPAVPPALPALAAATLAALLLAGCDDKAPAAKQSGGAPQMPPPEVAVVTVQPQSLPVITELPGRTAAYRVAEVRPQVNGILQKRLFQEGGEVKAGQQLYQIDAAPYEAAYASAQAALAKAQANVKAVRAKAGRYASLVAVNAISRQDYDDATASLEQNEADVAAARAALETARINLDYTRLSSPIGGRIGKSEMTEGALVTANQANALATVTQLDPIYVDVTQSTGELMRLRREVAAGTLKGADSRQAPVSLVLEDGGQVYDQPGRLQFSDVTVDQATGTVHLRAIFPNPRHDLLPGLFVRARIDEGSRDGVIAVPQQAVSRAADGGASVWVVGADGTAAPRPIVTEQAIGNQWVVSSGLAAGDQVVVEGVMKLRPGAPVRAVPAQPASAPAPGGAPSSPPGK